MSYVKSYFKSLFEFLCMMGLIILFAEALGGSVTAIYSLHVSVICALVGPIGLAIKGWSKNV